MQLAIVLEFLLSGVLTVGGLLVVLNKIQGNVMWTWLQTYVLASSTRAEANVVVAFGLLGLGVCYVVGVLLNVGVYDFFFQRSIRRSIQRLRANPVILQCLQTVPGLQLATDDGLYTAVAAFIDAHGNERIQRARDLETSVQRLARGALPGFGLFLVASLVYIDWAYLWARLRTDLVLLITTDLRYLVTALAVIVISGGSLVLAWREVLKSQEDEIDYLAQAFLILARRTDGTQAATT